LFFNKERRILLLFYVDNILLFNNKKLLIRALDLIKTISKRYELEDIGPVKSFLGIRVIKDRAARTITLLYNIYINKVTKHFNLAESKLYLDTPLVTAELVKHSSKALKREIKDY
jgi:hypothetical protein